MFCVTLAWLKFSRVIPFIQINIGFFANQIRITSSNTLDLGKSIHNFLLAIDIGIEETKNELKIRLLS